MVIMATVMLLNVIGTGGVGVAWGATGGSGATETSELKQDGAAGVKQEVDVDFEEGDLASPLRGGWKIPTEGWKARLEEHEPALGKRAVKLSVGEKSDAPFGNLMRKLGGEAYRGMRVRLSAKVRLDKAGSGQARMWLRVDRTDEKMGAFDNMSDRPITSTTWTDAKIEADVDFDAKTVNIGFMSLGGATVWVDAVRFEVIGKATFAPDQEASPPLAFTQRGRENVVAAARLLAYVRFFHPGDAAVGVKTWDHFAISAIERVESAVDAQALAKELQEVFRSVEPTIQVWAGGPEDAPGLPPTPQGATEFAYWMHVGAGSVSAMPNGGGVYRSKVIKESRYSDGDPGGAEYEESFVVKHLGGGVSARFALKVFADAKGTLPHAATPEALAKSEGALKLNVLNRASRLAGVVAAWGVFQHFYPYFDVVKVDWDAELVRALDKAAIDETARDYLATLRGLVSSLQDGHGGVYETQQSHGKVLPIALAWIENDLVVVGVYEREASLVERGDVILSIEGKSTKAIYKSVSKLGSAATQGWMRHISPTLIVMECSSDQLVHIELRKPDGEWRQAFIRSVAEMVKGSDLPQRPGQGEEVAPGIVYFNLDNTSKVALDDVLQKLTEAQGVIFDMRGYPGDAAYALMSHLIDKHATSAQWNIPIVKKPDREGWEWNQSGRWNLAPKEPRIKGHVVFLTDGRAISYAESIMGIVEAYKLGEIVGSTTAGTNGNVNMFEVLGMYRIAWTGMKVLKHDGSQHHGIGIAPTVSAKPTYKGFMEGRDEVLEAGIEVIKNKMK